MRPYLAVIHGRQRPRIENFDPLLRRLERRREVEVAPISWEEEAEMAGEEVVRLAQWVEREGPQIDMAARRERYPWLTRTEDYLRAHGWTNAAAAEEQPA